MARSALVLGCLWGLSSSCLSAQDEVPTQLSEGVYLTREWAKQFAQFEGFDVVREVLNYVPTYRDGPSETTVTIRVSKGGERRICLRQANREKSTPQEFVYDLFELTVRTQADAAQPPEFIQVKPGTFALTIRENATFALRMYGTDEGRGKQHLALSLAKKGFKPEQFQTFFEWSLVLPDVKKSDK